MDRRTRPRPGIIVTIVALCSTLVLLHSLAGIGVPRGISHSFSQQANHPRWLIATMSPAHSIQRRQIIRQTWQRLFADPSLWAGKFVISRSANPTWQAIIDAENDTYGDIIQLTHLEENSRIATTVKPIEFFKYLTTMASNPGNLPNTLMGKWKYVSKMDDDSFLDARTFYRNYLLKLQDQNRTLIARTIPKDNYTIPAGQFYTMTYDMVPLLVNLYEHNSITNEEEDVLVGRLLHEGNEGWLHIDLPNPVAFDYAETQLREAGKGFATKDADLSEASHAVGPGAINPHKMKDDETYVKVAACFDENGVLV